MKNNIKNLDKKKITLYSLYLVLGGIAFFIVSGYFQAAIYYFHHLYNWDANVTRDIFWEFMGLLVFFFVLLLAGVLLTITYLGFIYSKKYSRVTGIIGCILFISYSLYNIIYVANNTYSGFESTIVIPYISLFILSIILLFLTLIYWKKFTPELEEIMKL